MAFWEWWSADGRALADEHLQAPTDSGEFAAAMSSQLSSWEELGWAVEPGETAAHVLVLSAGDPDHRALARRVVLAAPAADGRWSYADSRPPAPDLDSRVLEASGAAEVDLARVLLTARMNDGRFDVQVHHPMFATLDEQERLELTVEALVAALGEVDVELWLGAVVAVDFAPLDGFGLTALRSVVGDLKRQRVGEDGEPGWKMLRGETAAGPLVVLVRSILHPLTAPHLDTYVGVSLPFAHRTEGGLPDGPSLESLRRFEDRLEREVGTSGQVVAQLSSAGVRVLHLYVDSTAGLLPLLKELAKAWDEGKADVHDMHDPGWQAVSHLRG